MSAVVASARAVRAIDPKYQLRRRGPESSAGDQKSLMTCGSCDVHETVAMVVMGTPRKRKTNGTAMLAKPTVSPKGSMSRPQTGPGRIRRAGAEGAPRNGYSGSGGGWRYERERPCT